ncbi:MAG: hypothetical protein ACO3UM_08720 [Planctomycetota bacterium]
MRRKGSRVSSRVVLLGSGVAILLWAGTAPGPRYPRAQILDAIRQIESSGLPNPPDGDQGRAIGPYQIHEVYWRDAHAFAPSLGGRYADCRSRAYAEKVIDAYMRRYAADAWLVGEAETVARIHNGGPDGASKSSTLGYWYTGRAELERRADPSRR